MVVHRISRCSIKPLLQYLSEDSPHKPYHLTPWDLPGLNCSYINTGLVFPKPHNVPLSIILHRLQTSLSATLTHFFPLCGRLVTKELLNPPSCHAYIDCNGPLGADFIHALAADVTISDVLSPTPVTELVESLFSTNIITAVGKDGHVLPLLAVQVTELYDGIFIAVSFNHVVGDGHSFWHFVNAWSEICRSEEQTYTVSLSRPPITDRWFLYNQDCIVKFQNATESTPTQISPTEAQDAAPSYRIRIFHFTAESIAHLKAKANAECNTSTISSFQALAGFIWRSINRARRLPGNQKTTCLIPVNVRSRLDPPLSDNYFGNCVMLGFVNTTVDELLGNNLGWAAWMLHEEIREHNNHKVHAYLGNFTTAPYVVNSDEDQIHVGLVSFSCSPRFDWYGNDFGWGNPIGVQTAIDKGDGTMRLRAGIDKGSLDLNLCLFSKSMSSLELDKEFMEAVSPVNTTA